MFSGELSLISTNDEKTYRELLNSASNQIESVLIKSYIIAGWCSSACWTEDDDNSRVSMPDPQKYNEPKLLRTTIVQFNED